ncbi:alpha/beta fold hydrolase [Falsibacillus albus]|uniref:Alpha/beta hydrolase n=1 Tax=Falsibacillus albus TaxID=2478915 RepID=A0A3L7K6D8_9BACI|nr:alpha/beta hydrolase [Falsibacillus albus]RLQ96262.1 alpha/beta hydrolase [Falsibacillus albus]
MNEEYIHIDGAELWTIKQGKGVPVILISGGPGCCDYLEPISRLIDESCEVIRFDPRGVGRSSKVDKGYELHRCLWDMEAIRKTYKIDKWIVIGHSWGADLALAYALLYPESLSGMVSIAGTGIQNDRDWKETYVKNKQILGESSPELNFPHNPIVHRSLIDSWRRFIKYSKLLHEISNIQIPSMFVMGEKDIRPSWPIEQIAHLIPYSTYHVIEGAGHYIWQNEEDSLRTCLLTFIMEKHVF